MPCAATSTCIAPAASCFLSKCTRSGVWPLSVTFFDFTSSVCFCSVNIIFPGGVGGNGGDSEPVSSAGGGSFSFFLLLPLPLPPLFCSCFSSSCLLLNSRPPSSSESALSVSDWHANLANSPAKFLLGGDVADEGPCRYLAAFRSHHP